MITFCPPAWQAAQLALNTVSPAATSAAKAGEAALAAMAAATAPAWAACGMKVNDKLVQQD